MIKKDKTTKCECSFCGRKNTECYKIQAIRRVLHICRFCIDVSKLISRERYKSDLLICLRDYALYKQGIKCDNCQFVREEFIKRCKKGLYTGYDTSNGYYFTYAPRCNHFKEKMIK